MQTRQPGLGSVLEAPPTVPIQRQGDSMASPGRSAQKEIRGYLAFPITYPGSLRET